MDDELSDMEVAEDMEVPTPAETGVGNEDTEVLSAEGSALNVLVSMLTNNGVLAMEQGTKVQNILKG